ncbi:MAG: HAD hydrolase-like protein [Spirochaetes bacterium]|nr:HAD hydrolase-like protein [Spirochaetota bacterium]
MAKTVILDFDGTLADSFEVGYELINRFAPRYGYRPVTREEIPEMKMLTAWQCCRRVGIKAWKIPRLARRVRKELRDGIERIPVFPGMPQAVAELGRRGYRLGIVTSNARKNVLRFLEKNDLSSRFDFVHSDRSIFGKWKTMQKVAKKFELRAGECVVVGDELRDLEAAWRNNLAFVGVAWGYNAGAVLAREAQGAVVEAPAALPDAVDRVLAELAPGRD